MGSEFTYWCRIAKANQPCISFTITTNTELLSIEQLGAVNNRLVHTLNGCAGTTEDDDKVQQPWLGPTARELLSKHIELLGSETLDVLELSRVLCENCSKFKGSEVFRLDESMF
jgi:hypothetical protein